MPVIVRDDDSGFFTRPAQLEAIYGPLWDQGIPVCIAVIPAQNANVRVAHRPNQPYDPSIPPVYRGNTRNYPILNNPELCVYLNQKARDGLVEICHHGYCHAYMEFLSEDADRLRKKLIEGRRLLEEAFPDVSIKTFIAPYDRISAVGLDVVLDFGYNICTATENLAAAPSLPQLAPYRSAELANGRQLFTCDEYLFVHREEPQQCLANARQRLEREELLIVGNHYWMFYYDWQETPTPLLEQWHRFVDMIVSESNQQITTFAAFGHAKG